MQQPAVTLSRYGFYITLLLSLLILFICLPLSAWAQADPQTPEEQAVSIASSQDGVPLIASTHPELTVHASFSSANRVWEITWNNPNNNRALVTVIVDDSDGFVRETRIEDEAYDERLPLLDEDQAIGIARSDAKVQDWLADKGEIDTNANLDDEGVWTVSFRSEGDTVAEVLVDDVTGKINEVRIGPQVAWSMARGYKGAFGRIVNEPYIWLPLCLLFLVPYFNLRHPWRLLHLDLLVLLSFSVSHYFFNQGEIFKSVPLAYPPLVYLFIRLLWMALRRERSRKLTQMAGKSYGRNSSEVVGERSWTRTGELGPERSGAGWGGASDARASGVSSSAGLQDSGAHVSGPATAGLIKASSNSPDGKDERSPRLNFGPRIMLALLAALLVFRIVINIADSNVVDVGYSGVIGAQRIEEGFTPYGHMTEDNGNGDTYGPLNYLLYVPFEKLLPWSGKWDDLPSAHAAAIFFDLMAVAGMYFIGRKLAGGGRRGRLLGLALSYGWAAYPYTTFVMSSNVNDSIVAAFIVWGFVLVTAVPLDAVLLGFATQIKFFPAILVPLWASYPSAFSGWKRRLLFVGGFLLALAAPMPVVFLGDGTLSVFIERSIKWQIGRDSPFSIWGQHPESLAALQHLAQYLLIGLAIAAYAWPPRKSLLQLAAASAALIVGFELVQTHWFYLYIPWFFPLAFVAILVAAGRKDKRREAPGYGSFINNREIQREIPEPI